MKKLEDLAEKKAKIYARLLTDMHLAEEMKSLALRHEERKELLVKLMGEKARKRQNEGGMSAMNSAPTPMPTIEKPIQKQEIPTPKTVEEDYIPMDYDAPPDETEMGGNAYFDESIMPVKKPTPAPSARTAPMPAPVAPAPITPAPAVARPAVSGDARTVFGTFLRSVRKTAKNGVLITICMDLDAAFEDGIFVLSTQSETAFRSLTREDHYGLIVQAFAAIGMAEGSFEIRLRGKKSDAFNKSVDEIKATFGGVKVEVK